MNSEPQNTELIDQGSSDNELVLKSIYELLQESFFIPAYQRGYRWDRRQVIELLDDILDFVDKKKKAENEFYCLQPVVVRDKDGAWELIDGQQRLTTIYLILSYFNSRLTEPHRKPLYSIEYETRPDSHDFLNNVDEERKEENIDFFYIYESFETINEWFAGKENKINDIESAFLNDVKIIWYHVREEIDPVAVFSRLNMGKIPLTNAELIKALFLKESNFEDLGERAKHLSQLKIAQEWDEIEKRLQEDEFWYFLSNDSVESNRIEHLLDLRAGEFEIEGLPDHDKARTFLAFNYMLTEEDKNVSQEWSKVKKLYLMLEEWLKDRTFYHLVGFLIAQGDPVSRIRYLNDNSETKTEFRKNLKKRIVNSVFGSNISRNMKSCGSLNVEIREFLEDLDFNSNKKLIRSVFLLFNIASILADARSNSRFQFDLYKVQDWDIEHIRSVSSGMPERADVQKLWISSVLEYVTGLSDVKEQKKSIEKLNDNEKETLYKAIAWRDKSNIDAEAFEELFFELLKLYDPEYDPNVDDSIGNLTLLDSSTNRSYKNSIFPIKRQRLIELDKSGTFVPLCTKNVFLKYYSPKINNMLVWSVDDSEAHLSAITEMLANFLYEQEADE